MGNIGFAFRSTACGFNIKFRAMRNRSRNNVLRKVLDAIPGKRRFGVYRFLPIFFCMGAALEFAMIKWTVGETNFYRVYKKISATTLQRQDKPSPRRRPPLRAVRTKKRISAYSKSNSPLKAVPAVPMVIWKRLMRRWQLSRRICSFYRSVLPVFIGGNHEASCSDPKDKFIQKFLLN